MAVYSNTLSDLKAAFIVSMYPQGLVALIGCVGSQGLLPLEELVAPVWSPEISHTLNTRGTEPVPPFATS